ncbi:hypothetical protein FEM48_Zijuj02G0175800 [Ziziphus jujuba var. spinosa]|uniref:Germin-like protein n=1 Tax=Ziziphus jujuba var. spinosa TaxID=714518 RepID=A0A978VX13_ZIZJJ|nr:hypothetical protein FEM48_Zijuj02G0175800 [Ziziphus jujuba var. spinosa]
MQGVHFLLPLLVLGLASSFASASDPSPLQDFYVAVKDSEIESAWYRNSCSHRGYTGGWFFHLQPRRKPPLYKSPKQGDVFVFPVGLIHFQFNKGHSNAIAFASLSSQNAGVITTANSVLGSNPRINPDVLTKAFQVDKNIIDYLQKQFWVDNN